MTERTKYQQKIIKNYYDNIGTLSLQKLSEQVSNLYLAEGKARERTWKAIENALRNLKVPESRIQHVRSKDDPVLVAKLVEELMSGKTGKVD